MSCELTEEQAAFLERIARDYGDMLYRYCAKCVSYNPKYMPLVPDFVQEVYLKASVHVSVLMYHGNIPGWLKKSCHFSLLNMLRNRQSGREILFPTAEKLQLMLNATQYRDFTDFKRFALKKAVDQINKYSEEIRIEDIITESEGRKVKTIILPVRYTHAAERMQAKKAAREALNRKKKRKTEAAPAD